MRKSLALLLAVLTAMSMAIPVMASADYPKADEPDYGAIRQQEEEQQKLLEEAEKVPEDVEELITEGFEEVPAPVVIVELLAKEEPVLVVKPKEKKDTNTNTTVVEADIKLKSSVIAAVAQADKPLVIAVKDAEVVKASLTIAPEQAKNLKVNVNLSVKDVTPKQSEKIAATLETLGLNLEDAPIVNFSNKVSFGKGKSVASVTVAVEATEVLKAAATIGVYKVNLADGNLLRVGTATIVDGMVSYAATSGACYIFIAE